MQRLLYFAAAEVVGFRVWGYKAPCKVFLEEPVRFTIGGLILEALLISLGLNKALEVC